MKRHHEDNPYLSVDHVGTSETTHSQAKRLAIRNHLQNNSSNNPIILDGNLSPPSSTESDSSSSILSTRIDQLSNSLHIQLCCCPNVECVIHDIRYSSKIPSELSSIDSNSNSNYFKNNLLLHYAHLERCRRHGQHIHRT